MAQSRDYLSNLDLLRFLAALWVVATHYGHIGPAWQMTGYGLPPENLLPWFKYGYLGVPIFFALSGFLIAHVSQNRGAVDFAFNRVIRLMPAFWASMTLSAIVLAVLGAPHAGGFVQWAANLVLLPQVFGQEFVDGVYWTLVYEFVFYGWVSVMLLFGVFHRHLLTITTLWLAISAANTFILHNGALERLLVTEHAGAFIFGLMFWHARKHGWSLPSIGLIGYSIFVLGFGMRDGDKQEFLIIQTGNIDIVTGWAFSAGVAAIVGLAIFAPQFKRGSKLLLTLGAISYPLYLLHQEIGYAVFRTLDGTMLVLPMILVMALFAIGMAWAIHAWCERPLQKLMQRLLGPVSDRLSGWLETLRGRFTRSAEIPAQ